jgi:hypothetical protein
MPFHSRHLLQISLSSNEIAYLTTEKIYSILQMSCPCPIPCHSYIVYSFQLNKPVKSIPWLQKGYSRDQEHTHDAKRHRSKLSDRQDQYAKYPFVSQSKLEALTSRIACFPLLLSVKSLSGRSEGTAVNLESNKKHIRRQNGNGTYI